MVYIVIQYFYDGTFEIEKVFKFESHALRYVTRRLKETSTSERNTPYVIEEHVLTLSGG